MRRSSILFVLALAMAGWLESAEGAVLVLPHDGCPSGAAITAHLVQMGAFELLSQVGTAEVLVEEPSLRLHFSDRHGDFLGERVVSATSDCAARAALAAAVIATFVGEWTPLALPGGTAKTKPEVSGPASQPWQTDIGAFVPAVYDGDEVGMDVGVRVDLARGVWLASAVVEGSFDRTRPLHSSPNGEGQGTYSFLRAGVGLGIRVPGDRVFWDAILLPEVDRLALAGKNLEAQRTVTRWGLALAGQTRLGWRVWRLRPFLFMGASYRVPGERMTLDDRPQVGVRLSAVNVEAGAGLSFRISP